jgi:spermidine synthase
MKNEGLIYFKDGELVVDQKNARVYKMDGELFLEIGEGHTLWALESEFEDYRDQLSDFPRGECLEIGLGLGVASRYILTFPKVTRLTTVEVNKDVILAHEGIKEEDRKYSLDYKPFIKGRQRHRILHSDGLSYAYQTNKKFDFIFIDCYDRIDEETLPFIADMAAACARVLSSKGRITAWLDKYTPEPYYTTFCRVMAQY